MANEENVSDRYNLPSPSGLKEKLAVGMVSLFAGTLTYLKSTVSSPGSLYLQEQSTLISSNEQEKVWIRKNYENFSTKFENDDVVIRIFINSVRKYGTLPLSGTRPVIREEKHDDLAQRQYKKVELGLYCWLSYEETLVQVEKIAGYLLNLGLKEGDKIAIFADTHAEWLTMFYSILRAKCTVVTVYSTLSDEAIEYALSLTEISAIFVDYKSLSRLQKFLGKSSCLKHVICSSSFVPEEPDVLEKYFTLPESLDAKISKMRSCIKNGRPSLKSLAKKKQSVVKRSIKRGKSKSIVESGSKTATVKSSGSKEAPSQLSRSVTTFERDVSFDVEIACENEVIVGMSKPALHLLTEILKKDTVSELPELSEYQGEDEVLIMFTSGSTGMPKGVILRNKNLVAAIAGGAYDPKMWEVVVYPAFLPLAHVFELVCELATCFKGGCIGYCRPLTLFNESPMLAAGQIGDFPSLGPTLSPVVPLVLERLKKSIIEKAKEKGGIVPALFGYGLNSKKYYLQKGIDSTLAEKYLFKTIRDTIGSRMRYLICGGAPLSPDTEEFCSLVMGARIKQGYGLTETSAGGSLGDVRDASLGNTGPPFPGVKFKLVQWLEGGYSPSDMPNPRGEVHLNGECVSSGYYKMPDVTDEAFYIDPVTNERWFRTGDIAEYLPNGTFRIIDRKKDIIKLRNGEYVSLVAVERAASSSPFVENLCAFADKNFESILLIVSTSKLAVEKLTNKAGLSPTAYSEALKDVGYSKEIIDSVMRACKSAKLGKNEVPREIFLVDESWTPDTGLVTPTMKVKRHEIAKHYSSLL